MTPKAKIYGFLILISTLFFPAKANPPLSIYGALPGIEMAALSPSGAHVAVIGVVGNERRLVVMAGNTPIFQQTIGELKVRQLDWGGEDRVLVTFSKTIHLAGFTTDKMEAFSVLIVPTDGSKANGEFDRVRNVQGGVFGTKAIIQKDGRWFGYFGGVTQATNYFDKSLVFEDGNPELYEVNLESGVGRRVAERAGGGVRRDWVLGPTGEIAASLDYNLSVGTWAVRNAKGQPIAQGTNPLGGIDLIGLGATANTVIVTQQDEESAEYVYKEIALSGGEPKPILQENAFSDLIVDRRSKRTVGFTLDQDFPETHMFDPRREKILRAAERAFPGLHVSLIDWSDTFDTLIVSTQGDNDFGTWWLVNLKTGQADEIGRAYAVASANIGPVKVVNYKASDGTAIGGVLTLPPGRDARNLPVIVLPHGGPGARDYPTFDWWPQALASRGYAVFQPNFRGSTGYGAAFYNAGFGQWGKNSRPTYPMAWVNLPAKALSIPHAPALWAAAMAAMPLSLV